MVTKFGRMKTYLEGLLPMKSQDAFIRWSCKITWQTKIIISPIPLCLWPHNLAGCWLTLSGSHPSPYSTLWWNGLASSRDNLTSTYVIYQSPCSGYTWENGKLPWGATTLKIRWLFNHVVLRDQTKIWQDAGLL